VKQAKERQRGNVNSGVTLRKGDKAQEALESFIVISDKLFFGAWTKEEEDNAPYQKNRNCRTGSNGPQPGRSIT